MNKIPFYLSKSGDIDFLLATKLLSRSGKFVLKEIKRDIKKYETRGFRVIDIHGDNEFNNQSLIDALEPVNIHFYAKVERVDFI